MGHALGVHLLAAYAAIGRAAAHREVVTGDHYRTTVDSGASHHEVRRREGRELAVFVVRTPGEAADLPERARVDEHVDALADGEPSRGMMSRDLLVTAHRPRQLGTPFELGNLWFPTARRAHASVQRFGKTANARG